MDRRLFLQIAAASQLAAQPARAYKAAIIGHTGRGNYGHGWDVAFRAFPTVTVVAVADPDDAGRQKAKARSGALRDYRDYREMLDRERPDLVAIGPRWTDQRVAMVTAVAEHGAHIMLEKPFAQNLQDADRMVAAAEKHRVKVQVAHTARRDPVTLGVQKLLRDGAIGQLLELRARGKEDRRAGGEDLIVLGVHCFDLMRCFAGDPRWVSAHISDKGEEAGRGSAREGTEPVGKLAGDNIAAMFGFPDGIHGYFASQKNDVIAGPRYGVTLYGSRGAIAVQLLGVPSKPAQILRSSGWGMDGGNAAWQPVEVPPYPMDHDYVNSLMVADLLEAIEKDREPACGARDGRWTIEMVMGVYRSHLNGARVELPLSERSHPLA